MLRLDGISPDDTVSIIETADSSVARPIVTGKGAHGVVVSDDGPRAFVSNIEDGTVSIIDVETRKLLQNVKVGDGPNGGSFRRGAPPELNGAIPGGARR